MADAPTPDMSMFGPSGGSPPEPDMSMFDAPKKPSALSAYGDTVKGAFEQVGRDFKEDHAPKPPLLSLAGAKSITIDPFLHPLRAGGVLRAGKEIGDVFGALTSPILAGPTAVIEQATRPPQETQTPKDAALAKKFPWLAPVFTPPKAKGIDVLQALGGLGPEFSEAELVGPLSRGASARPIVRHYADMHGRAPAIPPEHQEIIARIAKGVKGGGPTAQDMLDLARKTPDKPLTLMDMKSRPVKALAGKTYRQGGEAGQRIGDALEKRNAGQSARVEGDISNALGQGSAHATEKALTASRKATAAPLYTGAYAANPVVRSSVVDEVLRTKWGAQAWKAARDKARIGAIKDRRPVPDKFSLEVLDATKQGLDDAASAARRDGHNGLARDIGHAKNMFLQELDEADHTGLYAKARASYAGDSASLEALDFGKNALKQTPEHNAEEWAKMPPGDKEFARLGLAQTLRDGVADLSDTRNAAERLAHVEGLKRRIRPFFPDEASFNKFFDAATAEDTMFRTKAEIAGGSQTAERVAEDAGVNHAKHALNVGKHAATGNFGGVLRHGAQWLGDILTKPAPDVAGKTAEVLTAPLHDPRSPASAVLRQALRKPTPKPKVGTRAAPFIVPAALAPRRQDDGTQ